MFSIRSRLNAYVTVLTSTMLLCAGALAVLSVASFVVMPPPVTGAISKVHLQSFITTSNPTRTAMIDRALLAFDINADFSPAFNWNVKQLFVYLVVEYSTSSHPRNEMTLVDFIINGTDSRVINYQGVRKYPLDAKGTDLSGVVLTFRLMYHIMTYSGWAPSREVIGSQTTLRLPAEYTTK